MSGPTLRTELDSPELDPEGDEAICEVDIDFPSAGTQDLPLHVVFCIDVSGSMYGDPLGSAIQGGKDALNKLRHEDHFSVVAFSGGADTVMAPTRASSRNISNGESAIDDIKDADAGAGTTIMAGVDEALAQFSRMPDEKAVQWIVFLTDGSDAGFDPEAGAQKMDRADVTAHSAGFGGYDEETLETMAEGTNGTWKHIAQPSEMPPWFENLINNARGVVATDPELQIAPTGARLERGFYTVGEEDEPRDIDVGDGHSLVTADLGDLNAEDPPAIYLRFDVPETPEDESPLLLANLTLETRAGNATAAIEADLTPPVMQLPGEKNPLVKRDYALGVAGRTALDGDPDEAIRILEDVQEDEDVETGDEVDDAIGTLQKLKGSSGDEEKAAKDEASGFMRKTGDE